MDSQSSAKLSPKFFFLSLGVLVSLITSVSAGLILVFETLNHLYPDALNAVYSYGYNTYNFEQMRSAIATLVIVFPVFLALSYFWMRASRGELGRVDSTIRKWMIYIILFLAGVVIVVDLVTLVRYFISGEITTRFILKVLATLGVAGLVESFYMMELRAKEEISRITPKVYGGIAIVFMLVLIVISFITMGSPKQQRAWRFDDRRIGDLQSIQWQVINYWQQKNSLPENIGELSNPISSYMIPPDPEIEKGNTYEYIKTGALSFRLCATFSAPIPEGLSESGAGSGFFGGKDGTVSSRPYPMDMSNQSWYHGKGKTCFDRTIDPEIYPPFEKPVTQ